MPAFNTPIQTPEVLAYIERIAPSDASVLITGETGTGKELAARAIHEMSRRRTEPFVAVNCGTLTHALAESELFGHEKGAFTGALASRPGWFEAADGGTLFLDEIGDLSLALQVKLLRVLQEREIVRLGARVAVPVNVRLIAATNIDLPAAVAAGRFREDLYYRIHVARLSLLPLRQRRDDILPLARLFISQYGARLGTSKTAITADAIETLLAHDWPGNIRELENTIHHAMLVCRQRQIHATDLRPTRGTTMQPAKPTGPATSIARPKAPGQAQPSELEHAFRALFEQRRPELYDEIETRLVKAAFDFCNENQSRTAELLGISRNILRARLIRAGAITVRGYNRSDADNMPDGSPFPTA